jgi:hypothetical protein
MNDRIFGWSYPPGCSGPPEYPDPPKPAEDVWVILEEAGVDQAIIERVDEIVMKLCEQIARDCPACEKRAAEQEAASLRAHEEDQAMLRESCAKTEREYEMKIIRHKGKGNYGNES